MILLLISRLVNNQVYIKEFASEIHDMKEKSVAIKENVLRLLILPWDDGSWGALKWATKDDVPQKTVNRATIVSLLKSITLQLKNTSLIALLRKSSRLQRRQKMYGTFKDWTLLMSSVHEHMTEKCSISLRQVEKLLAKCDSPDVQPY